MMNKLIPPGSFKFDQETVEVLKLSQRGLVGNDLGDFIKRAGYKMADAVKMAKFKPGEVPIHLIVIGADEFYGPNRNGDAFEEAVCRQYHDTFVKHAHWYRNHQNKDPRKSYGVIKHSCYNEPMHRIELLVALNGTKEAAAANGGLVADKELEKIARSEQNWGISMACRVPFDICSGCGNVARTRAEYCTEELCKYGGLQEHMAKVADDGHHLRARNTKPKFFDCSDVWKPAERIGYVLGAIEKAAASGGVMLGGAELAEKIGLTTPFDLWMAELGDHKVRARVKLAADLAQLEERERGVEKLAGAWRQHVQEPLPVHELNPAEHNQLYRALADRDVLLPVRDFLRLQGLPLQKAASAAVGVRPLLDKAFTNLLNDPDRLAADATAGKYEPCNCRPSDALMKWAWSASVDCSTDNRALQKRAWLAAIRGEERVRADDTPKAELEKYAREYALYELAFLGADVSGRDSALTIDTVIRHNHNS